MKWINIINKFSITLSISFLAFVMLAFVFGFISINIVWLYFGASVISFITYAIDKSKAKRNAWRIKESNLHLLSLLGGWPGAGLAQQWLRHKSSKKEFRLFYWLTVLVNVLAVIGIHSQVGAHFLR